MGAIKNIWLASFGRSRRLYFLPNFEESFFVEAGRVTSISDNKDISVVMEPTFVRLDKDVRFWSHWCCDVDEGALQSCFPVVGRTCQVEHFRTKFTLDAEIKKQGLWVQWGLEYWTFRRSFSSFLVLFLKSFLFF